MSDSLLSVGLDVGTTSTQLVVSRLTVENRASSFAVPDMDITERTVLYKSPVYFTPLLGENLVDGSAIREIVQKEYQNAGIHREDVDTGAIIITGETSRKENARAVLDALSDYAGDFVVATAGPDLESVLAAKGAGATELSRTTGKPVLHMDIGGGTSNLALIEDGKIVRTGCLNVGGRLIKFLKNGEITYVSPALSGIFERKPGEIVTITELYELAEILTQALEMAAGLLEPTELMKQLLTRETERSWNPPNGEVVLSFSGGVAASGRNCHGCNSVISGRFWGRPFGKAACAKGSTPWAGRPSGLRSSARAATRRSCPAVRFTARMFGFLLKICLLWKTAAKSTRVPWCCPCPESRPRPIHRCGKSPGNWPKISRRSCISVWKRTWPRRWDKRWRHGCPSRPGFSASTVSGWGKIAIWTSASL